MSTSSRFISSRGFLSGLFLLALSHTAFAGPNEAIRAQLKQAMPDAEVTRVDATPIAGVYKVSSKNYEPVFASADGRFLIQGEMLEIKGDKITSVADQARDAERKQALAAVKLTDMIVFPATTKTRGVVYAFTDVDCGYCRKLHQEVPALSKMGIEVRYLAFPRSGLNTASSKKMDAVWCAKDRADAMTRAKNGAAPASASPVCKSPVAAQFQLGAALGVRGTPALFDANGTELGGYLPAAEVAKALGLR